ncbi:alkene reductase [Euzebya rosea]|uniref:alkene reductase n=1 Tax=Euzebya rosea TaxID=2052804 RepID=UPI000D3E2271|nr:alkene reductase [Euzebya rosea]
MTHAAPLLKPLSLGAINAANRVVMAPLTRNRAGEGRVPTDLHVEYYRQRAGFGAIVTEATVVSPQGVGYIDTPGLYTDEQVSAWRRVTDAVHDAGGTIIVQLWHVGRVSHTDFHDGRAPVAPTGANAEAMTFTTDGFVPTSDPRALRTDEIAGIVDDFAAAARRADEAGFDGVEIHGANGYLIEQFLASGVNDRTDRYGGGSITDRARFALQVVDAVSEVVGTSRTGIRLSLGNGTSNAVEPDPAPTLSYLGGQLAERGIAFVHVVEGLPDHVQVAALRDGGWDGPVVLNGGYDLERGVATVEAGTADAIAYGRLAIANPDLPTRFERGAELNAPDSDTFYGGGAEGYTDYPFLDAAE